MIFLTGGRGYIGGAIWRHLSGRYEVYAPSHEEFPVDKAAVSPPCEAMILAHGTIGHIGLFSEANEYDWMRAMEVNFFATMRLIKNAVKGTKIIVLLGGGDFSNPCLSSYFASKAAMKAMVATLAAEGHAINGISPGPQPSKMIREALSKRGAWRIEPTLRAIAQGDRVVPILGTLSLVDKLLDPRFKETGQVFSAREQIKTITKDAPRVSTAATAANAAA